MARPNNYLILVAFILATIINTVSSTKVESWAECAGHIGPHCGSEVVGKLIGHNDSIISTNCCYKLAQAGYNCHLKLTIYVLVSRQDLKNANWTEVIAKTDEVYHKCDLLTRSGSPTFQAKCTESLGSRCGAEIYNKLIYDKNITNHCCERLVKTGEACHVSMAKALIRSPQMRNVDAIQLLKKNKKIFDHCLHVDKKSYCQNS